MTARHLLHEQTAKTVFSSACAAGSKIDLIFELNPSQQPPDTWRWLFWSVCECVSCGSTQNDGLAEQIWSKNALLDFPAARVSTWESLELPAFEFCFFESFLFRVTKTHTEISWIINYVIRCYHVKEPITTQSATRKSVLSQNDTST